MEKERVIKYLGPTDFSSLGIPSTTMDEILGYLKDCRAVGLDTETTGLDFMKDRVIMLQIGDEYTQFVIDTRSEDISPLKPILESEDIVKILANGKFDYNMIKTSFGIVLENIYDVILVERVIHTGKEGFNFSLKSILERRLEINMSKGIREDFTTLGSSPYNYDHVKYGADDIYYLFPLIREQLDDLELLELNKVAKLECDVALCFGDIEYNGFKIDTDSWRKLAKESLDQANKLALEMDKHILEDPRLFGKYIVSEYQTSLFSKEEVRKVTINWNSPKTVLEVLRVYHPRLAGTNAKLDLEPIKYKGFLVETYIKYKEAMKRASSYGEKFLDKYLQDDGKIRTSFFQILETGRVSSSKPNMQQIPSEDKYRGCFVPSEEDWKIVSADYSSQELCIIATGSQDPVWLEALKNGQDLHSVCAELVYGDTWKDEAKSGCEYVKFKQKCSCTGHKELRTNIKTVNFGLAYGMGINKLSKVLSISELEASRLINTYFGAFPKIKGYLSFLGEHATSEGFSTTFSPFKRRRYFDSYAEHWRGLQSTVTLKWDERFPFAEVQKAGKNSPIQGTGADMVKLAMVYIRREIKENNWPVRVIMQVHDQIDTECHKDYAEAWKDKLVELMEKAALEIIPSGLQKAEGQITDVWKK